MPLSGENNPIRLLEKIVHKDKEAFERFYDLLSPLAFSLIFRMLKSKPDAEELLQDVFYYVWEKAANYAPGRGSAEAWLITIARSRAIDRLRARRRMPQQIDPSEDFSEENLMQDGSAQETLYLRDERSFLEKELRKLSDIQRETLELAYFEGLTQSEIAQKLELPLGTVKTRVRDGLNRLKEILGKKNLGQHR